MQKISIISLQRTQTAISTDSAEKIIEKSTSKRYHNNVLHILRYNIRCDFN